MLKVYTNQDATLLYVEHPELTNSVTGLQFRLRVGCGNTLSSIPVLASTVTSNKFQLTLSNVFPTNTPTRFPDGVYYSEIQFDYPSDGDIVNKDGNNCMLIDYDLKCNFESLTDKQKQLYLALKYANECDSCQCTSLCEVYSNLITTNTTTDDNPCGCN